MCSFIPRSTLVSPRVLVAAFLTFGSLSNAQAVHDPQELLQEATSLQQSGKFEQAIGDYHLLLQQYPNIAALHSNLGAALAGLGKYEEAIDEYNRSLKLQPEPQVQLNLGLAYYKIGRLTQAADAFKKAHALMPQDSRPVLLEADCFLRLGENKKVIQLLTPVEQQSPDDLAVTY